MKKVIAGMLAFSLLSTAVSAEVVNESQTVTNRTGAYIGLDLFQGETAAEMDISGSFTGSAEKDFDQDGFRLKLGKTDQNNTRYQVYFKSEDTDEFFDENVYGLGMDVMKAFPLSNNDLQAFILGGVSLDWTELEDDGVDYSEDSLNAFAFKLGLGALYRLNDTIEVVAGYDWQYRSWQEITFVGAGGSVDVKQEDTSKTFYAGLNFYF
mgnify:CR=1 FL=1